MTVILAARNSNHVSIAGDCGAFEDSSLVFASAIPKVWRVGDYLLGVAGSFRIMEIARRINVGEPIALRNALLEINPGVQDWSILVASVAGIWEIQDDYSVVELKEPYGSVGVGNQIAVGAMAVLDGEPHDRVRLAMKATLKHAPLAKSPPRQLNI